MGSKAERASEWAKRCKVNDAVFSRAGKPKEILDAALIWVRDLDLAKDAADAKVAELTAQLAAVETNAIDLAARVEQSAGGHREVGGKLSAALAESESLRAQVAAAQAEIESLRSGHGASSAEGEKARGVLEVQAQGLRAKIELLNREVAEAQAASAEAETSLERAQAEVTALRKAAKETEQTHKQEVEEASDDADALREKIAVLEQQRKAADELCKAALGASKAAKVRGQQTGPEVELEDAVGAYRVAVK